jgi:hypothetical protein
MSAIQLPDTPTRLRVLPRERETPTPVREEVAAPEPRVITTPKEQVRPRSRARARTFEKVVGQLMVFGIVVGLTYAASSLGGRILTEGERREAITAQQRARLARTDISVLRQRVERLTGVRAVERWALARGFQHPEVKLVAPKPRTEGANRVASR